MAVINLGKIKPRWRGEFLFGTLYKELDFVVGSTGDILYICKVANNDKPLNDMGYWEAFLDITNKADVATTLAGYGITDAYTDIEVDALLTGKADTATTLSGYGITDAYTKTQVDGALSIPVFKMTNTSVITLNDSVNTKITFNTVDIDTNTQTDLTNSRFKPTRAGYYSISGNLRVNTTHGVEQRAILYKNGSQYALYGSRLYGTVGVNAIVYLNGTTDYVELYAYADTDDGSTAPLTSAVGLYPTMYGHFLRGA